MGDNDEEPKHRERRLDAFGFPHMVRDMDRMVERAIASLVEYGKMTPEEAVAARERAEIAPRPVTLAKEEGE